jgi:hypothetical protein
MDIIQKILIGWEYKMSKTALLGMFLIANIFANETKTLSSNDKEVVIQVKSDYVMGDGDTRIDAKNIALQQAKNLASEYAGTFVKSELIIENDSIKKEQISTITTALMSVKIIDELYSITKDGRTKLVLTANTTLDKKSFIDKLKALTQDKDKQVQIISLQKENDKLKEKLLALNSQIQTAQAPSQKTFEKKPNKELFDARDKVLSEIDANENSIKKVFEKGALLSQAMKATSDFEEAKRDIDTNVFEYIKNNIKITLGEQKLVDNGDGTYNILVPVRWEIDNSKPILETLTKYYSNKYEADVIESSWINSYILIDSQTNRYQNKTAFSGNLYDFYKKQTMNIFVTIGKYKNSLQIAGLNYQRDSAYCIETSHISTSNSTEFGNNLIAIKNVPKNQINNLTTIEASLVINR